MTDHPSSLFSNPLPEGGAQTIAIFGGSFNPAHSGHMHVAETALERLGVDRVWWIVARGNPLKSEHGDFAARLASARTIAQHPDMDVLDVEARLGLTYTYDTLQALRTRNPQTRFVWLMGADNLGSFHLWKDWEDIASTVPIAIIARGGARLGDSVFEQRFAAARLPETRAASLATSPPPAWIYLDVPLNPASSTAIRAGSA